MSKKLMLYFTTEEEIAILNNIKHMAIENGKNYSQLVVDILKREIPQEIKKK